MKRDYNNNNLSLDNNSEYNTSADVEKEDANLSYVDPPKPLDDPNSMMEGNVPPAGGIVPMVVDLSDNSFDVPIPILEPTKATIIAETPKNQTEEKLGEFPVSVIPKRGSSMLYANLVGLVEFKTVSTEESDSSILNGDSPKMAVTASNKPLPTTDLTLVSQEDLKDTYSGILDADSERNISANVEKEDANLSYVDPPKPLDDPNCMMEGNVPPAGGIVPLVVDLSDNSFDVPIPILEPTKATIIAEKPKNQTEEKLGEFLAGHDGDIAVSETSNGKLIVFLGNDGTNTSEYADSEYNFSAHAEQQVAHFSYCEPLQPSYDPNSMIEGNVHPLIILPIDHTAPLPIAEPTNDYVFRNSNPLDFSRDLRIRELKNEIDALDSEFEAEKRPGSIGCCGCCPTSRKGKLIVLFIVLFFLGILGILAYIFFPRPPDINIQLKVSKDSNFQFTQIPENNTFRLTYAIDMIINVTNNNRYDIKPEKITIDTFISPDMTALSMTKFPGSTLSGDIENRLVGNAEDVGQRTFPSYSTSSFNLTLNINFSPDKKYGIGFDPTVGEFLRVCNPDAIEREEKMTILYKAYVDVAILQKLGLPPLRKVESKKIGCPVGKTYAAELFKDPMLARFVEN
jgi:hypothetical protein